MWVMCRRSSVVDWRANLGFWGGMLLSLLVCMSARAEGLHLVTGDDYAPFTGKALPANGMLTQVVQAVLADQGLAMTLDWLPWNRGYLKTTRGEYDATFPYVRSAQREADFLYSDPLYVSEQYLFSRAVDSLEIDDLSRQTGLRLCYPLGWQVPVSIQALLDQGALSRHSPLGLKECARLLLLHRDDLFIADLRLGQSALRSMGAGPEQFHRSQMPGSNTLHFIVSRQHPRAAEFIERFNRGLEAIKASGEYQRIIEGYVE